MKLICASLLCALTACAGTKHAPHPLTAIGISTLQRGGTIDKLEYIGHWDFVTHRKDGRYAGASARAFSPGDSMSIIFNGARLRLYGITGKNGGNGLLLLPGITSRTISFYSARPHIHKLLFDSGMLRNTIHSAGIVVVANGTRHRTGYVNIDEIEVDH